MLHGMSVGTPGLFANLPDEAERKVRSEGGVGIPPLCPSVPEEVDRKVELLPGVRGIPLPRTGRLGAGGKSCLLIGSSMLSSSLGLTLKPCPSSSDGSECEYKEALAGGVGTGSCLEDRVKYARILIEM